MLPVTRQLVIFLTFPAIDAWTGADMNLSLAAISCPFATRSPTLTRGVFGAPPMVTGIVTVFDLGKAGVIGHLLLSSFISSG